MNRKPILLRPTGKDHLWGGTRLNDDFAKGIDMKPLAETWECSTCAHAPSYAMGGEFDGMTLADVLRMHPEYLGVRHAGRDDLPLRIKMADAREDLSLQAHPTDEFAAEHENGGMGKCEFWYVLDAAKGTKIVYGLNHDCTADELKRAIENGTVNRYLRRVPVEKDDVFFVDGGTIHALGSGALVVMIQENSDLKYRLYDYDRVRKDGKKRELQTDMALKAANLKRSDEPRQPMRVLKYRPGLAYEMLTRCKYFEVHRMLMNTERRQIVRYKADEMAFRVLLCIQGCGSIVYDGGGISFYKGDCVFIPADSVEMTLHGQAQFLDIRG